jgi:predicted DCC family thiol-disulfide oxidoreductase YuxK
MDATAHGRSADHPLTLFYDAACPVCSLEMDHLRERDTHGRLVFVDIAAPGFDVTAYGTTLAAMNAEIHARRPDGSMLHGVEVLRLAYDAVGLGWVMQASGWPLLRPLADVGYRVFTRHRTALSRAAAPLIHALRELRARQTLQRMNACGAGACAAARPTGDPIHDRNDNGRTL